MTSGYGAPEVRTGKPESVGEAASKGGRLDSAAFAAQMEACRRELWCVAAAVLGRRDAADDVLQESAVIGLGKLDSFDSSTSFTAWMSQIVRFVALNHRRKVHRSRVTGAGDGVLETAPARAQASASGLTYRGDVALDQAAFDDAMLAALATLEPTARECLLLRVVMDMPYKDISKIVGIPEGTAMSHVHRSRRALRARLSSSPDHPSGGSAT